MRHVRGRLHRAQQRARRTPVQVPRLCAIDALVDERDEFVLRIGAEAHHCVARVGMVQLVAFERDGVAVDGQDDAVAGLCRSR